MIKQKNHVVDLLFSLALFCVFAASALTIVIMGADVYQKSVNDMNRNSTIRTSLSYLSEKIHQNDAENGIRIDQLNDLPSLVLTQNLNGETYETWIYAYDGMLCEIMTDLEKWIYSGRGPADSGNRKLFSGAKRFADHPDRFRHTRKHLISFCFSKK